jgi:hypothetical protein
MKTFVVVTVVAWVCSICRCFAATTLRSRDHSPTQTTIMMMMLGAASRTSTLFSRQVTTAATHSFSRRALSSVYSPTLVEARIGEAGTGGRSSVSGVKVALFGASGFLGTYVCGELGACDGACF